MSHDNRNELLHVFLQRCGWQSSLMHHSQTLIALQQKSLSELQHRNFGSGNHPRKEESHGREFEGKTLQSAAKDDAEGCIQFYRGAESRSFPSHRILVSFEIKHSSGVYDKLRRLCAGCWHSTTNHRNQSLKRCCIMGWMENVYLEYITAI